VLWRLHRALAISSYSHHLSFRNFINNQKIYQDSAAAGAKVGLLLAFIVILVATRSLIVAVCALLSIGFTLLCVLGGMQSLGWELGTIEAILISITAGFSVDYVVHLAHAYIQKADCSREDRVMEAFEEMGVSVFSGMATSFMAAFVLLFCQLRFFYKFGVFLAMTIAFSWLWANVSRLQHHIS
jgi:predicted RND superfamily exporter protein